eukprot:531885-Amphidinium_carterae.1
MKLERTWYPTAKYSEDCPGSIVRLPAKQSTMASLLTTYASSSCSRVLLPVALLLSQVCLLHDQPSSRPT